MNFHDPVLWICSGILLFGTLFLIWAIGKLRGPSDTLSSGDILADGLGAEATEIDAAHDEPSFALPALNRMPARAAGGQTPPVPKEIADRLENMTQRLTEMQTVLSRQASTPTLASSPGAAGQGFSPETIDKLLKIIGNVIQQVDILQKSLNMAKPDVASASAPGGFSPKPASATAPASGVRQPGSIMGPLSAVKPAAPGTGPAGKPPSGPAKI